MRNFFLHSFILIFCFTVSGCQLSENIPEETTLEIALPVWPPQDDLSQSYPQLSRWRIIISSADSQSVQYTKDQAITLSVRKNHPACITATPVTLLENGNECIYFKPAGYIYPETGSTEVSRAGNTDNSSLPAPSATWSQGFLADIMQFIFQKGPQNGLSPVEVEYAISTFNWKKAQETIDKKISSENQIFYNPWLLSQNAVIDGICQRTFKTSLLNLSGTTAVSSSIFTLKNPVLSSFIPENQSIVQKKQFTVMKNTPILIADAKKYGLFINYKSSKNISLEYIFLPIYIGDI